MKDKSGRTVCQLHTVPEMCEPVPVWEVLWQLKNRCRRVFKRRYNFLLNAVTTKEPEAVAEAEKAAAAVGTLQPGDLVMVKSKEGIKATLDNWNQTRRCAFMEEMWPYCGTKQKVLKRVEKFLDEKDYLIKKCKGIVILEGATCPGTIDFGACDRTCHFFWREEWLEKIEEISAR